jgi:hypothetical protein
MQRNISTNQVRKHIKTLIDYDVEPDLAFIQKCFECVYGDPHIKHTTKYWEQRYSDEEILTMAREEMPIGYSA